MKRCCESALTVRSFLDKWNDDTRLRQQLSVSIAASRSWSAADARYVVSHYATDTAENIANALGKTIFAVRKKIAQMGLNKNMARRGLTTYTDADMVEA